MKLNVQVDKQGKIIGTAQIGRIKLPDSTMVDTLLRAASEQTAYEVEVPDELIKRPANEIHLELAKLIHPKLSGRQ